MILLKALINRRWRWATLLVLLGMVVLARLGIWQLDRLAERQAANIVLAESLQQAPLAITADFPPTSPAPLQDRLVLAEGAYDFAYQGIIKLQNWQGRAGVHLLAPLVLADGETAVLVNRGWIPEAMAGQLSTLATPGNITINGYVGLSQTISRASTPTDELAWFRVDIEQIQGQMPYQLLPFYIIEWSETGATADLPIHIPREIDLSEGPHLSYALQWFAFMLMLGIGYLFFVRRSLHE